MQEVLTSIASKRSHKNLDDQDDEQESSGFGVEDSFLVTMSKQIEEMKKEEELNFLRDKAEIMDQNHLNYSKSKKSSASVSRGSSVYRKMLDDDDVDSAVVGAGEGGQSYFTDKKVDYGSVYGSNFVLEKDTEGTPRSANLLKVLQSSVSLKEVAKR